MSRLGKSKEKRVNRLVVSAREGDHRAVDVAEFDGEEEIGRLTVRDEAARSQGAGFLRRISLELGKLIGACLADRSVKKMTVEIMKDNKGNESYHAVKLFFALKDYVIWSRVTVIDREDESDRVVASCARNY